MGFLSGPSASVPAPPPPPPANPPTYASANVQSTASGAKRRMAAAAGAGFEGSLFTGPQGAAPGPTAKQTLGT